MEPDYVTRQVQGHLILGPFIRHGWSMRPLYAVVILIAAIFTVRYRLGAISLLYLTLMAISLFKVGQKPSSIQARHVWLGLKWGGGFLAMICIAIAPFIFASKGDPAWWMWIVLGLVIVPGPEFLRGLGPYQKYISAVRIVLIVFVGTLISKYSVWR